VLNSNIAELLNTHRGNLGAFKEAVEKLETIDCSPESIREIAKLLHSEELSAPETKAYSCNGISSLFKRAVSSGKRYLMNSTQNFEAMADEKESGKMALDPANAIVEIILTEMVLRAVPGQDRGSMRDILYGAYTPRKCKTYIDNYINSAMEGGNLNVEGNKGALAMYVSFIENQREAIYKQIAGYETDKIGNGSRNLLLKSRAVLLKMTRQLNNISELLSGGGTCKEEPACSWAYL